MLRHSGMKQAAALGIALLVALSGCKMSGFQKNMRITPVNLTEKEKSILLLAGVDENGVYDYTVDDGIRSMEISVKRLEADGGWQDGGGIASSEVSGRTGRFAVTNPEGKGRFRVARQTDSGVISWNSNPPEDLGAQDLAAFASTWSEGEDIVPEQPIPLALYVYSKEGRIQTFGVEAYWDTERLMENDKVYAVTATFSEQEIK